MAMRVCVLCNNELPPFKGNSNETDWFGVHSMEEQTHKAHTDCLLSRWTHLSETRKDLTCPVCPFEARRDTIERLGMLMLYRYGQTTEERRYNELDLPSRQLFADIDCVDKHIICQKITDYVVQKRMSRASPAPESECTIQ